MSTEFSLTRHVREYHYDYVTVLPGVMSKPQSSILVARIEQLIDEGSVKLVDHTGMGTSVVSDAGGRYLHYIFEGSDVRRHFPELGVLYRAILPVVAAITSQDVVLSPHQRSDVNIKCYPPGGGTLGQHFDTNGITVLLFLTTNQEAPLRMQIPRWHPLDKDSTEGRDVYAEAGSLLVMKGREVLHGCVPTVLERKMTVILNYYVRDDTWRDEGFDDFVYDGKDPGQAKDVRNR